MTLQETITFLQITIKKLLTWASYSANIETYTYGVCIRNEEAAI